MDNINDKTKKTDLYADYEHQVYTHFRKVDTGRKEKRPSKRATKGYKLVPIKKDIEVPFDEVKNLRLDRQSPAIPQSESDFTIMSNYLLDYWSAILGDSVISAYMHLRRYAYGSKDYCYPDIDTIALKMSKSPSVVNGYFEVLEEYGFVAKFHRRNILAKRDVSPLFKIRKFVPILTEELYNQLPEKLKESHDDFMEEIGGIEFASSINSVKVTIGDMVTYGKVINSAKVTQKIEQAMENGTHRELLLSSMSVEARENDEDFHDFILSKKISKPSYETFILNTIVVYEDKNLHVVASNIMARDWLKDKYSELIEEWAFVKGLKYENIIYTITQEYLSNIVNRGA